MHYLPSHHYLPLPHYHRPSPSPFPTEKRHTVKNARSSSQVQPGAAANKQPRGTAKMCSKEAHVGAAAISHAVQLPRWHMT
ncbi:hypothetical protein QJQ45_028887 [Haematococcus lacustris]|nr:hypothetical protein QJQ45_028887 [Haematococcus lacustris]